MMSAAIRPIVAVVCVGWVALQAVTVLVVNPSATNSLLDLVVAGSAYLAGGIVCHQLPERSFHVGGAQWPVCARCAGVYAGAALTALVSALAPLRTLEVAAIARVRTVLVVAVLPSVATLVYEWAAGLAPTNVIRASAGAPLGAIVTWVVVAACAPRVGVEVH